jgi:hypothetical protein
MMKTVLLSLVLLSIAFGSLSLVFAESEPSVPYWIKDTAYWWGTSQIADVDFLPGLKYLIEREILAVPLPLSAKIISTSDSIPDWVKDTARWYGEEKISESKFLNSLQFLIRNGFINVNDIEHPHGIFALTDPSTPDSTVERLSSDPHVHGVTLRSSWMSLEPSQGAYAWNSLDSSIEIIENNKKQVKLIILTGWRVPTWLYNDDSSVPYFESHDRVKPITNPVFWDERYLEKYEIFVKNVFEKYNDHPSIVGITIAGPSVAPAEMHMAKDWPECSSDDSEICHTKEKWLYAWKQSLKFFDTYSEKSFGMAIAEPFEGKNEWKKELTDYAIEKYSDKIFLQYNGHRKINDSSDPLSDYVLLRDNYSKSVPVGAQMVQSITKFPNHGDLFSIFSITHSESNFDFIEVYSEDVLNEKMRHALEYGHSLFVDKKQR